MNIHPKDLNVVVYTYHLSNEDVKATIKISRSFSAM